MHNPIDTVRVDKRSKQSLSLLKRRSKIQNWNTLCRWGFIYSLTRKDIPNKVVSQGEGAVEMTWKVFAGPYGNLLWALLKKRVLNDNLEITEEILKDQFKRHLYRGIQDLLNYKVVDAMSLVNQTMPKVDRV